MAHLTNFGIGNFKAIKNLYNFEFRPITILTGTNSSGKSSLTKAILLFKEGGIEKKYQNEMFENSCFKDLDIKPELNLGKFETFINKATKDKPLEIKIPCRFSARTLSTIEIKYLPTENLIQNGRVQSFKIYNNDSNNLLLEYIVNDGTRVNFSEFYELALYDSQINAHLDKLKEEIDKKAKQYNLKIKNEFQLKTKNSYPKDLITLIERYNELKIINDDRYTSPARKNIDTFSSPYIYLDAIPETIEPDRPIFDYLFQSPQNFLEYYYQQNVGNIQDVFTSSESMILNILKIKKTLTQEAAKQNKSLGKFLLDEELRILNSIKFNNNLFSDFDFFDSRVLFNTINAFLNSHNRSVTSISYKEEMRENIYTPFKDKNSVETLKTDIIVNLVSKCSPLLNDICAFTGYEIQHILLKDTSFLDKLFRHEKGNYSNRVLFFKKYMLNGLKEISNKTIEIFDSIYFIPSIRGNNERRFQIGKSDLEIHKVIEEYFKRTDKKTHPFIEKYVREFGLADSIELELSSDNFDSRIKVKKGNDEYDLADIGYGFSQLLPIIIRLGIQAMINENEVNLNFNYGSIFIIEEPETNLHPALQSKLAEMFMYCYKRYNIQFIIETHSEYLIRKLQYLTAKGEISEDDTQLYYFENKSNSACSENQIKKINILKDGGLSAPFGTGFYDEATKLMTDTLNLNLN